jgi:hypothetical protein
MQVCCAGLMQSFSLMGTRKGNTRHGRGNEN